MAKVDRSSFTNCDIKQEEKDPIVCADLDRDRTLLADAIDDNQDQIDVIKGDGDLKEKANEDEVLKKDFENNYVETTDLFAGDKFIIQGGADPDINFKVDFNTLRGKVRGSEFFAPSDGSGVFDTRTELFNEATLRVDELSDASFAYVTDAEGDGNDDSTWFYSTINEQFQNSNTPQAATPQYVNSITGYLADLDTDDKTNLVAAINEHETQINYIVSDEIGNQIQDNNDNYVQPALDLKADQTDLDDTNSRVTQNESDISDLDTRVTTNEQDIIALEDRVTQNEVDINSNENRITQNENNIEINRQNIESNESRITQHDSDIASLQVNYDNLDQKVDTKLDEIVVLDSGIKRGEGVDTLNFGAYLDVTDNGNGQVTINGQPGGDGAGEVAQGVNELSTGSTPWLIPGTRTKLAPMDIVVPSNDTDVIDFDGNNDPILKVEGDYTLDSSAQFRNEDATTGTNVTYYILFNGIDAYSTTLYIPEAQDGPGGDDSVVEYFPTLLFTNAQITSITTFPVTVTIEMVATNPAYVDYSRTATRTTTPNDLAMSKAVYDTDSNGRVDDADYDGTGTNYLTTKYSTQEAITELDTRVYDNQVDIQSNSNSIDNIISGVQKVGDADLLDGIDSSQFVRNDINQTLNADYTLNGDLSVRDGIYLAGDTAYKAFARVVAGDILEVGDDTTGYVARSNSQPINVLSGSNYEFITQIGGQTIFDELIIEGSADARLRIKSGLGEDNRIIFATNELTRWQSGVYSSEHNYQIRRYIDGVYQENAMQIRNSDGYVTFAKQIRSGLGTPNIEMSGPGGSITYSRVGAAASGLFNIDALVDDGQSSSIRFHRSTNTSGVVQTQFFRGDGSATAYANIDHKTGAYNGRTAKFEGPDSNRLELIRSDSNDNVNIKFAGSSTVRYLGMYSGELRWGTGSDLASAPTILTTDNVVVSSTTLYSGTASSGSFPVGDYTGYDWIQVQVRLDGTFWNTMLLRPSQIVLARFYVQADDAVYITYRWDTTTQMSIGGSANSQIRNVFGWNISK